MIKRLANNDNDVEKKKFASALAGCRVACVKLPDASAVVVMYKIEISFHLGATITWRELLNCTRLRYSSNRGVTEALMIRSALVLINAV